MKDLDILRLRINEIDEKMADLFSLRMKTVKEISEFKLLNGIDITDIGRENQILNKASDRFEDAELNKLYCDFISDVISLSKSYQRYLMENK